VQTSPGHIKETPLCYGRLAIVSDVDGGGVCPECRQREEDLPCYIEASTTERCWDQGGRDAHKGMNALSKHRGCIEVQSLDKECTTREDRKGIQGLDKYVDLEPSVPRSQS
jgi:hypothetical protein